MCALAEGSDHAGSLRNPGAYCNLVGFRVSARRIPAHPSPWVYDPFSVHGPMARTVRDAALMLSLMAGPDERVPISISEPLARAAEGGVTAWRVAWSPDLEGLLRVDRQVRRLTEAAALKFAERSASMRLSTSARMVLITATSSAERLPASSDRASNCPI
jgi:amidase